MPLKYCITSQEYDPHVLEHPVRGSVIEEKMLGIVWNIIHDNIVARPRYNLFGASRGKVLGPNLVNMSEDEIAKAILTRLSFLRLTA